MGGWKNDYNFQNAVQPRPAHAGSPPLPGTEEKHFWMWYWRLKSFEVASSSLRQPNLWVKKGPAFVFQARKGNQRRSRIPLPASQILQLLECRKKLTVPALVSQAQIFDPVSVWACFLSWVGTLERTFGADSAWLHSGPYRLSHCIPVPAPVPRLLTLSRKVGVEVYPSVSSRGPATGKEETLVWRSLHWLIGEIFF